MRSWWPLCLAMVGAAWLAVFAVTPLAPRGAEAPATAFSAMRAMADVREISRAPHPTGSADNARVRAWLIGRLTGLGGRVQVRTSTMSARGAKSLRQWSGDATPRPVQTLIAVVPGRDRTLPAVMLMAHYDSVWGSPGAADDGAGVASILETLRALRAAGPQRRDVLVALTDGEELGMEGATAFFAGDPELARVGVVLNLDVRGGGGRVAMFETGRENGAMMRLFASAVRHPSATSLSVLVYHLLPNNTDFTPAEHLGLPGFNFAFIGRPEFYHSPLSTADSLDQGALQDMGDQILDLAHTLLATPTLPGKSPDLVFFDIFGVFTLAYPPALGWLVMVGACALYGVGAWRGRTRIGAVGRGFLSTIALIVVAGGLLYLGNLLSGDSGQANYYDRLAKLPLLEVQALLIGVASAALVASVFRGGDKDPTGFVFGAAAPLLLLGLALQAVAPTADFFIAWPLLLGGLATAAGVVGGARMGALASVAASALGGGYLLGLSFFLMEGVGPNLPSVAALPLALVLVLTWPLIPPIKARVGLAAAALPLVVAIGLALWVRSEPLAPSVPLYSLGQKKTA